MANHGTTRPGEWPANKRQKTTHKTPALPQVIVISHELQPDMRVTVFDIEFHVDSASMRAHSAFFRTFLDSPDKVAREKAALATPESAAQSQSAKFKYDWVTQIDEDKSSWHLATAEWALDERSDYNEFEGDWKHQQTVFNMLLCAIHGEPYYLTYAELVTLVGLADYYRALPILSRTLDESFERNPSLGVEIEWHCVDAFVLADKLRHAPLFRECLVYLLGPWQNPRYLELEDRKLWKIAHNAYNEICAKIADVQEVIIPVYSMLSSWEISHDELERIARSSIDQHQMINLPMYYRKLSDEVRFARDAAEIKMLLNDLLENNLKLSPFRLRKAGEDMLSDSFLCGEIDDDDLPWDLEETDW
ncbi:uncharacterized protein BP5553_08408 [Venustampulla echinocandica]|uniref:BTB domain-containing protein n=1 Tax=Venustampulla echinocandica TaxID=2656787 RepID=A0A370TE49_9HELO|nr:uncharacterized protein BP5553_08408 [Venustampulla echinocandica]RDL32969.1 hypothetical protein BP5553_08408 [Venustampulla echinocandica]